MSSRARAIVAIIIASLLWGTAGTSTKILLQTADPFVVSTYRFAIASLLILPYFLRAKKPASYLRHLIPLSLLAASNIVFFYIGIHITTANATTLIYAGTPLATAFLAKIIIKEDISRQKFFGVLMGLVGVVVIIVLPLLENQHQISGSLQGNMFIVLAVLSWTLYSIGSRHYISSNTYTPILMTSINFFVTFIISLLITVVVKQQLFSPTMLTFQFMGTLLYSGIFVTFVTYLLFQWAIKHVSTTTAQLKHYVEPIVGVTLNASLLGEHMSHGFITGSFLIFMGIAIMTGKQLFVQIQKSLERLTT